MLDKTSHDHLWDKVYFGDCLDIMRDLPDDSIDLIVTSPPYADARKHTYGGVPPEQYVKWFSDRSEQMLRILKPTGSFVLNIKERAKDGERHTYVLDLILATKREVGFRWVEEYMWHKTTAAPGKWKYRFRDSWERLLHFSKTKDLKMNQDAVQVPIGDWTGKRLKNMNQNDLTRQESATKSKVGRCIANWEGKSLVYPTNVLHKSPVAHNTGHSAAFPEWLPEFFIKLFTEEGDIVLGVCAVGRLAPRKTGDVLPKVQPGILDGISGNGRFQIPASARFSIVRVRVLSRFPGINPPVAFASA